MRKILLCLVFLALSFTVSADKLPYDITQKIYSLIPSLSEYTAVDSSSDDSLNYSIIFYSESKHSARVTTAADGTVLSYMVDSGSFATKKRLPKISKTQATQTAISFVERVASDIVGELNMKVFSNTYNSSGTGGYNIRFLRNVGGVNYSNDSVSVWVDAQSGEVTRYSRVWNKDMSFLPAHEIISKAQAEEFFKTNIKLKLRYNRKIEDGRVVPYLVYVPSLTASIDAVTGEATSQMVTAKTDGYKEITAIYDRTPMTADGTVISIENRNALLEGLKTGNEAQKRVREMPGLKIDSEYSPQQAKYYMDTNGDYLMTIRFVKDKEIADVTLNAKTLDIVGFTNSESVNKSGGEGVGAEKARAITNNFLYVYMRKYFDLLTASDATAVEVPGSGSFVVTYERTVNGIPYKSNYAQFLINPEGDIASLAFTWDNVEFESPDKVISLSQAYDVFFDRVGLSLIYMQTEAFFARLVYTVNSQVPAIIDAKSGIVLSYDGKPVKPKRSLSYIGLDGHYAQNIVTALADCDIFVSEGNVFLDDYIYQKDFIVLLASISPDGMPIYEKTGGITDEELDMIYNDFITKGVIEKNRVNKNGFVTREEAAMLLLRATGYKGVAELKGIFKMPFADSGEIREEYFGYVALARGLKLIAGSDGYFYPSKNLTNADALIMVYNYLSRP